MTISFDDSEVKENELLIKIKKGYKPTRLSFNFSFLTDERKYNLSSKSVDKVVKSKIIDKIAFLSSEDKVMVLNYEKHMGHEKIDEEQV